MWQNSDDVLLLIDHIHLIISWELVVFDYVSIFHVALMT
jgi:hypothetical protein